MQRDIDDVAEIELERPREVTPIPFAVAIHGRVRGHDQRLEAGPVSALDNLARELAGAIEVELHPQSPADSLPSLLCDVLHRHGRDVTQRKRDSSFDRGTGELEVCFMG